MYNQRGWEWTQAELAPTANLLSTERVRTSLYIWSGAYDSSTRTVQLIALRRTQKYVCQTHNWIMTGTPRKSARVRNDRDCNYEPVDCRQKFYLATHNYHQRQERVTVWNDLGLTYKALERIVAQMKDEFDWATIYASVQRSKMTLCGISTYSRVQSAARTQRHNNNAELTKSNVTLWNGLELHKNTSLTLLMFRAMRHKTLGLPAENVMHDRQ